MLMVEYRMWLTQLINMKIDDLMTLNNNESMMIWWQSNPWAEIIRLFKFITKIGQVFISLTEKTENDRYYVLWLWIELLRYTWTHQLNQKHHWDIKNNGSQMSTEPILSNHNEVFGRAACGIQVNFSLKNDYIMS